MPSVVRAAYLSPSTMLSKGYSNPEATASEPIVERLLIKKYITGFFGPGLTRKEGLRDDWRFHHSKEDRVQGSRLFISPTGCEVTAQDTAKAETARNQH